MIVAPYRDFPFLVPQTFHEFFATVQRAFLETHTPAISPASHTPGRYGQRFSSDRYPTSRHPRYGVTTDGALVSISLPIHTGQELDKTLAPLVALETLAEPSDQHFYWEKQNVGDAIAAVGCIAERQLVGPDRFVQTQGILDEWFAATTVIGELDLPFTGPHAFCRFTFFDQLHQPYQAHQADDAPFPPASVFLPKWHLGQHHHQKVFVANIARGDSYADEVHNGVPPIQQQCLDLWQIYQRLRQPTDASQIMPRHKSNLNPPHRHLTRRPPTGKNNLAHRDRPNSSVMTASASASASAQKRPSSSRNVNPAVCASPTSAISSRSPISDSPGANATTVTTMDPPVAVPDPLVKGDRSQSTWSSTESFNLPQAQKEEFQRSVQAALGVIESTDLTKAVLAQVFDVTVDTPFQVFPSLHNLRQTHGDCHVFSTANGKGQVFLGASPERLLSIRDRTLYTEAIAGSAPRGTTPETDEKLGNTLLCSIKELHEHQLVVNYITQQLAQLNLEPQRSPFPKLLQLPNIQHLHTPIMAKLPPDLSALDIVGHLHPTPAVAGVPQAMACELIQSQESFERSLYAAPIGWINYRGDSEFIVGIRSALLNGQTARLYAGAGIVRGSQPELEVSEIELKLQALLTTLLF